MKIEKTEIEGLLIIQPDVFGDERGFFFESYSGKKYKDAGIDTDFVQDNISKSKYGTVRGLHFQICYFAQGKLCEVINGAVLYIAVVIRSDSPTYGKHLAVELSGDNHTQFWIPPGFAHGFSVLSDEAFFMYKCTNYYSKEHERAVMYNDPELNIDWKVEAPVVSDKDMKAGKFIDSGKYF